MALTWGQFHRKLSRYIWYMSLKIEFKIATASPRASELTDWSVWNIHQILLLKANYNLVELSKSLIFFIFAYIDLVPVSSWSSLINSLTWHQISWSSLVQVMVHCLSGPKPLLEPLLTYCQLNPQEQASMKIEIQIHSPSFNKMHLKLPSAKFWPFCPGVSILHTFNP